MENELNSKMKKWFPAETKSLAEKEKDEEYVFEIGITLAGAISGGAYAAGVFDFLFETLDAWYIEKLKAKNEGRTDVPQHDVCIKVLTGASAGSINGLVMALVARREFSHGKNSPFYKIWVDDIDISKLTALDDLSCGEPESLLNSNALDKISTEMQKEVASAKKYPLMENYEEIRKWLGDSIEMSFASTNLNGTAYKVNFRGVESEANPGVDSGDGMDPHWVYQHRELINYAIPTTSSVEIDKYPPNYFYLGEDIERPDWCSFMKSGLASSAFPVALKSRDIRRPKEHYKYMYVYLEKEEEKYYTAAPTFSDEQNDVVTFTSVDGGAMNNEPFAYAHKRLAGIHGQNPREGINAHRAVLMVDPFPERPEEKNTSNIEQSTMTPIIGNFFKLISSWKDQARFKEKDLATAQNRDVYSRFIIAPRRSGKTNYPGAVNLASGSLGAFGGFFHKEFRHHDYELGRRNAQKFFRDEFMLPNDNIIMKYGYKSITTDLYSGQSGREDRTEHKQIIPIMGESVTNEILQPVWPSDVFDNIQLNEKTQMVFKRLDRVIRIIVDREISGFWMRIIAKTALWWFKKSLKSKVYSSLKDMQSLIKNS